MSRHDWSRISPLHLGQYAEYFVKMELTLYGLDIYSSEVDDRGIDFVARTRSSRYYDFQVKSIRGNNYIFFQKEKFKLRDNLVAAIVVFSENRVPDLYLIPSIFWKTPNELLVSRDYEGKKSKPEWGINISQKNMHLLELFRIEKIISMIEDDG
jgi:hypothetical protein